MSVAIKQHVFAGCKFTGRQGISEVLNELERQHSAREDFVISSEKLRLRVCDGELLLISPRLKGGSLMLPLTNRAHIQLAQRIGIPTRSRLYHWLLDGHQNPSSTRAKEWDPKSNWDIWTYMVNEYFTREKTPMLVRVMRKADGVAYCRALLSNKYKIMGNADLFYAVVEELKSVGAEIWHARLSEDRFYGYAVAPHISGQINLERSFDPGDGWKSRWYGKAGDVLNAAMAFGNSETGEGGIFLSYAILRRVCENYCVWNDIISQAHVGKRHELDSVLSDETLTMQNQLIFAKLKDLTKSAFDPSKFGEMLGVLEAAAKDAVEDPEAAAEALQVVYDIGEDRKRAIRNMFIREQDNSRYGLINAVTQYAHASETDPDKGFDLEKLARALAYEDMSSLYKRAEKTKRVKKTDAELALASASPVAQDEFLE